MEQLLGSSLPVFIGLTVVIMGFASFMTGQALANTWKPAWQVVLYALMLAAADRFLVWGLFAGELLSLSGYLIHGATLVAIGLFAYRVTQAHKMVAQYPWIYERRGLFGWREKSGS